MQFSRNGKRITGRAWKLAEASRKYHNQNKNMRNPKQSFAITIGAMTLQYDMGLENIRVTTQTFDRSFPKVLVEGDIIATLAEELYRRMSKDTPNEELCRKIPVRELQTLLGMVEKARKPRVCYSSQPMDMMEAAIEETKQQLEPVYQTLKAYCSK